MPRHGDEYEVWSGRAPSLDEVRARYGVEEARFVDELVAAAGLYWTSIEAAGLHDDGVSKAEHEGQAAAYSWALIILIVFSIVVTAASVLCPNRGAKPLEYFYVYLN